MNKNKNTNTLQKDCIPKTIYYCWFGKNKKNKIFEKCKQSWRKYLPEYNIIEINEENFNIHVNKYVEDAYKKKKWAFVSDYARLWYIYKHGGIYFDTDVELIKSFNFSDIKTFFCLQDKNYINTGLGFGSMPNSKIIKKMIDDYEGISFIKSDGTLDLESCPVRNTRSVIGYFTKNNVYKLQSTDDIIIFSSEYFCPIDFETKKMTVTENTIAIHWFDGTWLPVGEKVKIFLKKNIIKLFGYDFFKKIKNIIKNNKS